MHRPSSSLFEHRKRRKQLKNGQRDGLPWRRRTVGRATVGESFEDGDGTVNQWRRQLSSSDAKTQFGNSSRGTPVKLFLLVSRPFSTILSPLDSPHDGEGF
ncbi:unnamed protein product [Cuscuta epithymum]|uniref:Uncharacterized protein n=1 Tax=Cuscuta epithymum TaxID=186058 RepID=A0AAV0FQZ2_9ASTE|nr:unnamed protein product [Cuscuta epithymum]